MSTARHPINVIVQRTGLTAHVIRVWERRYGAVKPDRTETNRRVYSDEDIKRLSLLKELTGQGRSIGFVAHLGTKQLERLVREHTEAEPPRASATPAASMFLEKSLSAVRALDDRALQGVLAEAEVRFGIQGMLQRVVAPFAEQLGQLWRDGSISAAHEHFASAVLRTVLGQAIRLYAGSDQAPVIVFATPSGQLHELGALIAAALASNLGWKVIYLGASLPAAEIAGAARQHQARVVGLSVVYPADDTRIDDEFLKLRGLLPREVRVVAGGRAAPAYQKALDAAHIVRVESLDQFGRYLDEARTRGLTAGASSR